MQYILLPDENQRYFLADRNEQIAINNGITQTLNTESEILPLRLMYGVYKPQIDNHFTLAEIREHICEAIGQQLHHIQNTTLMNLRIISLVLSDNAITDVNQPHYVIDGRPTQDLSFAALIEAPSEFEIDEHHRKARSAYVQGNHDVITTLKNRKGLFAFSGEEKRFHTPLTKSNWTSRINHFRVLNEVKRVQ
ncbi:hypothetical protein [Vibrio alginolyticus]|uniref:hypothetical protein n=1 Tax=Vibrio alginolyticus TaxID=663 RepID=UPI002119F484|nr:hypothetical protein [Vibrio alginolyticus]MCQ9090978.1 hypothetical protein [Vibrio alginolyticus]